MNTPAHLAFARMHAAHTAFVASFMTDQRPAAIVESDAADEQFMASMVGALVWVQADYLDAGAELGTVSMAFDRGDVRTEHGVINWGNFCMATDSLEQALAFFAQEKADLEAACALDAAEDARQAQMGHQMALVF